jgi:hypothetical protein
MEAPSGLCATCRCCLARLYRYRVGPWSAGYYCLLRIPSAPHVRECAHYEREPGAD